MNGTLMKALPMSLTALFFSMTLGFAPASASTSAETELTSAFNQFSACENNECEQAMRQFLRLSRGGSGDASALAAVGFANGEGLEHDEEKAKRYIQLGVRQGSGLAAYILSDWHRQGFIVEQDNQQAFELLEQAIGYGHAPAMHQKAVLLMQASDLEGENRPLLNEAIRLFEQAAEMNLANSMYALARMKHTGAGMEQNLEAAAELYRELTMLGHPGARENMREISSQLAQSGADESFLASLDDAANIERIQVRGESLNFTTRLDALARRLNASGQYDTRGVGTRIRGVTCEQTGQNCSSGRPDPTASSLNEILTGQQGQ